MCIRDSPTTAYAKTGCALTQARRASDKTVRQYTKAALPPARYASERVLCMWMCTCVIHSISRSE
eukprot:8310764-Alexandrium_andersonii.AAC.1